MGGDGIYLCAAFGADGEIEEGKNALSILVKRIDNGLAIVYNKADIFNAEGFQPDNRLFIVQPAGECLSKSFSGISYALWDVGFNLEVVAQ